MNPNIDVADLIEQKKWIPLAAVVIWFLVRLLKSDTKIPITLNPRHRMIAAFVFGAVAGILDKIASGTVTWQTAIFDGLLGAALAVIAQNGLDALLNGRDVPIPGLIIPGARPNPNKPPTIPPPAGLSVVSMIVLTGYLSTIIACGAGAKACAIIDLANHACTVVKYLDDDGKVKEVPVTQEEAREFAKAAAKKRAQERAEGKPSPTPEQPR